MDHDILVKNEKEILETDHVSKSSAIILVRGAVEREGMVFGTWIL